MTDRVRVRAVLDRAGQAVLAALPEKENANMAEDRQLREITCDPKFRKVLVTDGKTAVGQALVKALAAAPAPISSGSATPSRGRSSPASRSCRRIPQVTLLPLDVTDSKNVREVGGRDRAARSTSWSTTPRTTAASASRNRHGVETARAEMDVNYFGLLRLAQEFGPAMRSRGADGSASAVAWVNLLSIYALANFPPHGTFSASKAAAHSLAQCLRAEMRPAGVRVVNVFPGPIDDEWNQLLPPPKLAPADAGERSIVNALQDGIEDVYPGDVAQEWLARWRDNPKALERELSA